MAPRFGRPAPDPRLGSPIELGGGDAHSLLDLLGIGKALASKRVAAEEAPPALLQIQPAGAFGNEDLLEARMVCQPGAGFQAVMAAQIVRDNENVAGRIVRFDLLEQLDVMLGVARSRTAGDLLAIMHA